jgi:Leucine Rich repeat
MSIWLVTAFAACVGFGPPGAPADVTDEAGVPEALKAVEGLGGTVVRDEKDPRHPVVEVDLGFFPEPFPARQLECLWRFKHLRSLSVGGYGFKDAHLQTITCITSLERLHVNHTAVTDEGLAQLPRLHNLKELRLEICSSKVTDECLKAIGALPRLETLRLESYHVTGAGFKDFKCKSRLRKVDLMKCRITDDGLQPLAEFPELEELILTCDYRVTDKGIQHLSHLKHLRELGVSDTRVTIDGAAELRRSLPDLLIVY